MKAKKEKSGKYHKWLKSILKDFSKENKGKIVPYNHSIKISSEKRHSKSIIEYEPDFSFKFKTGKKSFEYIIFEFLDKQNYEGIIADIMECVCIENCRLLLFLSKESKKHKESENITDIISDSLDRMKGEKVLDIINLHIPLSMDKEDVKKEVYKEISKKIKLTSN
ncbi:MAG: hypothetical protein KKG75_01470 [Nanoarchaeota archaeon]|nr:hypothetical protein [Nanoarchaeota archaeon]